MDVINVSIAIGTDTRALRDSVKRAVESGIVVVAAAGNNQGMGAGYPARYPGVISVGSLDAAGHPSSFSAIDHVNYFAPGEDIPAVDRTGGPAACHRDVSGCSNDLESNLEMLARRS
ncbi:hypothetical protein CLE01_33730 [Cryobacterium levicorallinum]|nr:hypothetical protein CLE01_33730 [Cryobacterium levicorallinum]